MQDMQCEEVDVRAVPGPVDKKYIYTKYGYEVGKVIFLLNIYSQFIL